MSDLPFRWTCVGCGEHHDGLLPDSVEDVSIYKLGCPGCGKWSLPGEAVTAVRPDFVPAKGRRGPSPSALPRSR